MSDISKQQATVAAHQTAQPQQAAQMQQQVDGQAIQVQLAHDGSDQMHTQGTQAMQNLQSPPSLAPIHSQAGAATITTMSTGAPQQMTDWPAQGRLQVIQQPLQNPTYIQPVYNGQGQLIVPGNIALHPGSMNQPIQVIAAGKPFQPGQMPHMLTTQGKSIVQGQATSFPGYATIPTSAGNQTLVISPLGVIGQTNILSPPQNKPQEMPKMMPKTAVGTGNGNGTGSSGTNGNLKSASPQQQSVSIGNLVSSQAQAITTQAQAIIQPQIISPIQYACNAQQQRGVQGATPTMQFAPWQATFGPASLPQGLTWAPGIQSPALLTQGSQIFIRNSQPDQPGMFIQNAQPSTMPQPSQIATGQQINKSTQGVDVATNVQPKNTLTKAFSTILPNSVGQQVQQQPQPQQQQPQAQPQQQQIKTSAGVGTQTAQPQPVGLQTNLGTIKMGPKIRAKTVCRMPAMATSQKADAANQTKPSVQLIQPKLVLSNIISPQETKVIKPGMPSTSQATQQPQPLTQIQQMQNIFPEQVDQKPPVAGQLMMSNGVGTGGSVVTMPAGQMTPLVGNMIVQTLPGISSLTIPTAQTVPDMLASQASIKQENAEQKDPRSMDEDDDLDESPEPSTSGENSSSVDSQMEDKQNGSLLMSEDRDKDDDNKENRDSDRKPNDKDFGQQKATMMVKPQVLTHVIEGFVIQESSEPFPVNRGCIDGLIRKIPSGESGENGEPPVKKASTSDAKEMAICEFCGKRDLRSKFKKSRRFCSLACARREGDKAIPGGSNDMDDSMMEHSLPVAEVAPENQGQSTSSQDNENRVNPLQWSVADVCEFIRSLPGCSEYVEDFALQDIDGEALMLLKPDHLMTVMSMKLGPAVKIIAKIDSMRHGDSNPAA